MYIRIRSGGTVELSLPRRTSEEEARCFLLSHRDWIEKRRAEMAARPERIEQRYTTGETCYLWGEPLELVVKYGRGRYLAMRDGKRIMLHVKHTEAESTKEEREAVLYDFYRADLMRRAEELRPRCEEIVGKRADEYRTRRMKTKWGVCNITKKRIWLNSELAKRSVDCLEYVLFHELTHLHERLHNVYFHALMDAFCPDWRQRKERLNREWESL
ncbi:SprT family zinc-dependent metalloprotease [Selenomonas sp. TAMA-11512]|nr:SprT family zinc-dependent metalloprotease [Selenomonas sp. TAMA-11512]